MFDVRCWLLLFMTAHFTRCGLLVSCSWDDSSSVSSGFSDTLDNISTDDLNTPAYSTASSSRKAKGAQVSPHNPSLLLSFCCKYIPKDFL